MAETNAWLVRQTGEPGELGEALLTIADQAIRTARAPHDQPRAMASSPAP